MADAVLLVLLIVVFYLVICLLAALIRTLFARRKQRGNTFRRTFWTLFLEILNPLNWF